MSAPIRYERFQGFWGVLGGRLFRQRRFRSSSLCRLKFSLSSVVGEFESYFLGGLIRPYFRKVPKYKDSATIVLFLYLLGSICNVLFSPSLNRFLSASSKYGYGFSPTRTRIESGVISPWSVNPRFASHSFSRNHFITADVVSTDLHSATISADGKFGFRGATYDSSVMPSDPNFSISSLSIRLTEAIFQPAAPNKYAKFAAALAASASGTYTICTVVPFNSLRSSMFVVPSENVLSGNNLGVSDFSISKRVIFSCSSLSAASMLLLRSFSTSSSSFLARSFAFPARSLALPACTSVPCASILAAPAANSALAALSLTIATNAPVFPRIAISTPPAAIPTSNSPRTPSATNAEPSNSQTYLEVGGFSGECIVPRRNSRKSCRRSHITTATSITTPVTTTDVQTYSQNSSTDQEVSRLLSVLSKADSSMDRFYKHAFRLIILQIVSVGLIFLIAIGYVIVVSTRER